MYVIEQLAAIKTPLVNKFYTQHRVRGRANKQDQVWVAYYNQNIVAACRVQDKTQFLFLSTLFVASQYRSKGLAKKLLLSLLKQQNKMVYTFAYKNIADLYYAIGFDSLLTCNPQLSALYDMYKHRNIVALQYPPVVEKSGTKNG
jgi:GNAT superfamily N-acetyltransferase